ncbi:MAG: asnB [Flaviaesturariibacter sp.]|nr:asnB [Flaviaesturariibacter sp.]
MCGIAGMVSTDGSPRDGRLVEAAVSTLRHRGPECSSIWSNEDGTVTLGHCRLSIIDLSPRSGQPFSYSGRYTITYNGELYNYKELRAELAGRGSLFTTESDTEVVIAAFAAFGPACLQRFDGAFAFAIWDDQEGCLFAARDRFGEKPLFFSVQPDGFLFASELRAFWQWGVPKIVNESLLYNFLALGYVVNPTGATETFYTGIQKLPAASSLTLRPGHDALIETYWNLQPEPSRVMSDADAIDRFTDLFRQSVSRRLRADVAVGTSLSGGLDSSAVVAFCQEAPAGQYTHRSFTAVFPGYEKNEQAQAALVAKTFGLQGTQITVDPGEVVSLMDKVMACQEEPVSSGSPLAQYRVFQAAKTAGVTVLLDGQGADEILAGYGKYYRWYWAQLFAEKKLGSSAELAAARALGVREPFGPTEKIAALAPHFAASIQQVRRERAAARDTRLAPAFAAAHKRDSYYMMPARFDLNSVLQYNTTANGLEELLRLADRNSMAHAVEVRLPFLSHELVEFLFSLPPSFKIRDGWTKWLLRKAVASRLPAEIVWRTDKTGFEPPQKAWMERPDVQEAVRAGKELLVSKGILDPRVLQQKIQPHTAYAAESWDWRAWSASYLY